MSEHLDRERLVALRHGRLTGAESREALNHVAGCAECQRGAREAFDVGAQARELVRSLEEAPPAAPRRFRPVRWLAAAAAILAAVVTVPLLRDREEPSPETPPQVVTMNATATQPPVTTTTAAAIAATARPERWESLVREAASAGALKMPAALVALQPSPDRFRTSGDEVAAPAMRPFAEVVETDRPRFRWPAEDGATFMVLVGERGRIVTQSPSLSRNEWMCDVDLPRGRTYTWQVEIRRGEETAMLPMPPAPPARFGVLDAESKSELDEARRELPGDHLLLGVLYARAGLREAALEELRTAANANVDGADVLLGSVAAWRR